MRRRTGWIVLTLCASAACATSLEAFERYDANGDALLDAAEFRIGARDTGYFDVWDIDDDGFLDKGEIDSGLERFGIVVNPDVGHWDANDDRLVSEDEFLGGAFDMLDADGDARLDREELQAGIEIGSTS